MEKDLERELDRLYALPLSEFTGARNELGRQLSKEGRRAEAARVKELSKPTVAAWTANQLARREKKRVAALLEAGAALRKAQESALAGGGSDPLRDATTRRTDAVRELVDAGRDVLGEAGAKASGTTLERLAQALRAAAVDEEARDLLARGRLSAEPAGGGFEAVGEVPSGAPLPASPRRATPSVSAKQRQSIRRLEQEARRLARDAAAAERDASKAESAASHARARADATRGKAEKARERASAAASDLHEQLE